MWAGHQGQVIDKKHLLNRTTIRKSDGQLNVLIDLIIYWRRERDSNPRGESLPPIALAMRPLQPLGYLSNIWRKGRDSNPR